MPEKLLTYRYVLALSLVAGLTVWGQVLVQNQLSNQEHDAWLVNNAGKQRFRSQEMVKDVLLLLTSSPLINEIQVRNELTRAVTSWERHHTQFRTGNFVDLSIHVTNSAAIQAMYGRIEPHFNGLRREVRRLTNREVLSSDQKQQLIQRLLTHEGFFLGQMNQIVQQYQLESQRKVDTLRTIEWWLTAGTLVVLLLEALLIFRPFVKTLRKAFGQLIVAQQVAEETTLTLLSTNEALQQTQQQLLRETGLRHQQQLGEQRIRMASLVQGQEEERRRLSRDLHDGIGQMMTGLKLLAENLRSTHLLPDNEQHTYVALKGLVIKIIQETRHVSNNLMPPVLSDFGLEPALRYVAEQTMQQSGLTIRVLSQGADRRLDSAMEIGLYRIAQEALTNAIKHADASEVDIELRVRENRLLLSITDNGKGVDIPRSETAVVTGQGLHNMRQRARLMDGILRLISQPGMGTRIVVTVPLEVPRVELREPVKKKIKI